jgi:uncharacterized protein (UPF0147 family)
MPPEVWAATLARRAQAERSLDRMIPELETMANDPSVPKQIRGVTKAALSMATDDRWAPEVRAGFVVKFLADPELYSRPQERLEGPRLPPPRRGALPVPDDTPWAPPRRRARK